jgi:hypothetical protein
VRYLEKVLVVIGLLVEQKLEQENVTEQSIIKSII